MLLLNTMVIYSSYFFSFCLFACVCVCMWLQLIQAILRADEYKRKILLECVGCELLTSACSCCCSSSA